jgi:ORF6N domain
MASDSVRTATVALARVEDIDRRIVVLRGRRVVLDADLALLYGVPTKRFNEQVRRNLRRFPPDFMFQLINQDFTALRSQIATLETGRGQHSKYRPRAFTEHGAIMAATVLNSARAVEMSVYVVRAFVRMREVVSQNRELAKKLAELEQRVDSQDETIVEIVQAIRSLTATAEPAPDTPKRKIGFV